MVELHQVDKCRCAMRGRVGKQPPTATFTARPDIALLQGMGLSFL